jgi:hypothetical protein
MKAGTVHAGPLACSIHADKVCPMLSRGMAGRPAVGGPTPLGALHDAVFM